MGSGLNYDYETVFSSAFDVHVNALPVYPWG